LTTAMPAIFIILAVGIIVGSWMYAGTVPALIYYSMCNSFFQVFPF
jgi:NhaC family Na+:H+ antiporter